MDNEFSKINQALFDAYIDIAIDDYSGMIDTNPFRITVNGIQFSIDDNFDKFGNSECAEFDINTKKGQRALVRFVK